MEELEAGEKVVADARDLLRLLARAVQGRCIKPWR